jgi:hypothetical protein
MGAAPKGQKPGSAKTRCRIQTLILQRRIALEWETISGIHRISAKPLQTPPLPPRRLPGFLIAAVNLLKQMAHHPDQRKP